MHVCPNCGKAGMLYYAASWCAGCGWHKRGQTLSHANFSPDPTACTWCRRYAEQEPAHA